MLLLAVRMEIEIIFKNKFFLFFGKGQNEAITMKLANDVITHIIDPNIFYSRLSFYESGREAIHIKHEQSKSSGMPTIRSKFFTRSALV
jgi:hypothetical protein